MESIVHIRSESLFSEFMGNELEPSIKQTNCTRTRGSRDLFVLRSDSFS